MLGQKDSDRLAGGIPRKSYLRSVSWSDRSPTKPNPKPQPSGKARSCLPPLQPLSIARRSVEEWPTAGSDDLGVWPNPQTPRGPAVKPLEISNLEQPVREFQFKKDKLAFYDKECSRIADHIYLGSDAVAKDRELLRQNGITHVLNCVGFVCPEYFKSDLVYKTLWLQDSPSEDITSILYDVFDYFEDVREQGGRVLVHCYQGVSRSTSLVIAYLMWREGQSFEDAFQFVKAARGVTNPNIGFAVQLLLCQKRVHAAPASPNSMVRIYRMAPHSSYDPLHLVPKMLNQPDARGLDSRGAFIVHVPTAIFVWTGKNCSSIMLNQAKLAANQVIRYERAQGPLVIIKEGEEPSDFWDALAKGIQEDSSQKVEALSYESSDKVRVRKVDDYDLDFELFHNALAGGVVPQLSVSNAGSEVCLPIRENGWCKLRQKFANGVIKQFLTSSNLKRDHVSSSAGSETCFPSKENGWCKLRQKFANGVIKQFLSSSKLKRDHVSSSSGSDKLVDTCREANQFVSLVHHPLPVSPDSLGHLPSSSLDRVVDSSETELSATPTDPFPQLLPTPSGSPDSFSCFLENSPKFSYKSPTSPSTSDYSSSSFAFSPSSSNWSDLSYLSSQQPSPSGLEATDLSYAKNAPSASKFSLPSKEIPSPSKASSDNHALGSENSCLPPKAPLPSIAERRGSNPPPFMVLPSVDEQCQLPQNLIRSWSFSLTDLDVMKGIHNEFLDHENSAEELILDSNNSSAGSSSLNEFDEGKESDFGKAEEFSNPVLYQWPNMNKVDMQCFHILDSLSVYILLAPDLSLPTSTGILYVWLGKGFLCEEKQSELRSSTITSQNYHLDWEEIGRNFLNQINFPESIPVQIVKEGEEPEQFLTLLNGFSFQKVEGCS